MPPPEAEMCEVRCMQFTTRGHDTTGTSAARRGGRHRGGKKGSWCERLGGRQSHMVSATIWDAMQLPRTDTPHAQEACAAPRGGDV